MTCPGRGLSMAVEITPADHRYAALTTGMNQRWQAKPQRICLPRSAAEAARAVQAAMSAGLRLTVRSGGGCYRDFVCNAETQVIIDVSELAEIEHDARFRAISIGAGARLLPVYETLYRRWGVTIPGGQCPTVGMGGHVTGGGFGLLSRRHGLTVDHLYGVEVVTVGADGEARLVTATREDGDPNRELWWAHTGGGGGNFGIVTRFLFRTPGAHGGSPARLLPSPPADVLLSVVFWPWADLAGDDVTRLVRNYGQWYERNRAPGVPEASVAGYLILNSRAEGSIALLTQVDATVPGGGDLLDGYLADLMAGVRAPGVRRLRRLPWLKATQYLAAASPEMADPTRRGEFKSAYYRRSVPDAHADAWYRHLAEPGRGSAGVTVLLFPYGGQVSAAAASGTAAPHRDSVVKMLAQAQWTAEEEDRENVEFIRGLYADTYRATGGVPVPDTTTDGCFINYPDTDLSDPAHNTSGIPWHRLYYKDLYPRLQRVKAAWDPLDVFRHAQSVELPAS